MSLAQVCQCVGCLGVYNPVLQKSLNLCISFTSTLAVGMNDEISTGRGMRESRPLLRGAEVSRVDQEEWRRLKGASKVVGRDMETTGLQNREIVWRKEEWPAPGCLCSKISSQQNHQWLWPCRGQQRVCEQGWGPVLLCAGETWTGYRRFIHYFEEKTWEPSPAPPNRPCLE